MRTTWHQRGFTLIELIMVIVLMGIVGGIVAVFMRSPIDAYFSGARRAALTDTADTTVRRMARDLRRALPNSVRACPAGVNGLEFIPTKTGARYRAQGAGALDFNGPDTAFNMLGDNTNFAGAALPASQRVDVNDLVVVYNLGITGASAYAGDNTSVVRGVAAAAAPNETQITIDAKRFPLASGSNRFHVVAASEQMVSYVCTGNTLWRTVSTAPTTTAQCLTTGGARIAVNVNCAASAFSLAGSDLQRNGLATMVLTMQDSTSAESIALHHEVHVDNAP